MSQKQWEAVRVDADLKARIVRLKEHFEQESGKRAPYSVSMTNVIELAISDLEARLGVTPPSEKSKRAKNAETEST